MSTEPTPSVPAWHESLDPALVARLQRPLVSPGIVSLEIVQRILGWVEYFSSRLPLLGELSRRRPSSEGLRTDQVPIVHARWVQDDATGVSPGGTATPARPGRPGERVVVVAKTTVREREVTGANAKSNAPTLVNAPPRAEASQARPAEMTAAVDAGQGTARVPATAPEASVGPPSVPPPREMPTAQGAPERVVTPAKDEPRNVSRRMTQPETPAVAAQAVQRMQAPTPQVVMTRSSRAPDSGVEMIQAPARSTGAPASAGPGALPRVGANLTEPAARSADAPPPRPVVQARPAGRGAGALAVATAPAASAVTATSVGTAEVSPRPVIAGIPRRPADVAPAADERASPRRPRVVASARAEGAGAGAAPQRQELPYVHPGQSRGGGPEAPLEPASYGAADRMPRGQASDTSTPWQVNTGSDDIRGGAGDVAREPARERSVVENRPAAQPPRTEPALDVDDLVEKVQRKLLRQLAVERERRGGLR